MKINDLDEEKTHNNALILNNSAQKTEKKRRVLREIPKNRSGFDKSEIDPFQTDLYESAFVGYKKDKSIVKVNMVAIDGETKEEIGSISPISKKKRTDKTPFVKVFTENMEWLDVMPPITRVLFYFLRQMEYKKNMVRISRAKCIKETQISMRTLDNAIIGLISGGCIKETDEKNVYWINPSYFYRGDRLDKIDEANEAMESARVRKKVNAYKTKKEKELKPE